MTIAAHLARLEEIVVRSGERLEGNCFYEHGTLRRHPLLRNKQVNLLLLARNRPRIMEIGFNAGHSCLLFLLANPRSQVQIFDLGDHHYTQECFEYLDRAFPGRLSIAYGDSRETVPAFIRDHPGRTFDLIHVDGGHLYSVVKEDMRNARRLSHPGTVILYDDVDGADPMRLCEELRAGGQIGAIEEDLLPTPMYPHLACRFV